MHKGIKTPFFKKPNKKMTENLKFIIERYDHYIESVQSKSNLYITLNTFFLTGAITLFAGFKDILNNFLTIGLLIIIGVSIASLIYTLLALFPQTKKSEQDSVIFFGSVAEKKQHNEYYESIKNMDEETFKKDLAQQVQQVAKIVCKKHIRLRNTNQFLIVQIVLVTVWIIIFFITIKF